MADGQPAGGLGRQWPRLALYGSAAFVAGAVISFRWQVLSSHWPYVQGARLADLTVVVPAVVAGLTGLFVCARSRRPVAAGWLATTVALAALGAYFLAGPVLTTGLNSAVLAVVVGVALGGVLAAAAVGETVQRVVVVTLLASGLLSGTAVVALFYSYQRHDWVLLGCSAVLAASAALVGLRRSRMRSSSPMEWTWASVGVVAALGVAVWLVARVRASLLDEFLFDIDNRPSRRRVDVVGDADHLAVLTVSVVIILLAAGYAYRVGGRGLARWVIVATGLSYPIATLSVQGTQWLMATVLVAAAAGLLGAAATVRAGRVAPWDAIGLLIAGWATYALAVAGQARSTGAMPEAELLITAAMAFAAGAGVAALIRGRSGSGGGLVAGVLLGLSSLMFVLALVRVLFPEPGFTYIENYPMGIPVVMTGAAVLLVLLWGLGRLVEKLRRDVRAEAEAG